MAHCLTTAGLDPSYMIGAVAAFRPPPAGVDRRPAICFLIEGDENIRPRTATIGRNSCTITRRI